MNFHILEWVFETLNKRVMAGVPLSDLFIVLPFNEESEIEWDIFSIFNKVGKAQGNDLQRDYPALWKLFNQSVSKKDLTIRVFFVHPSRSDKPRILNRRKFNYPKVNQLIKSPYVTFPPAQPGFVH
jgi:hypothetical protein